ncbi:MAG TPA: aminodeoxychorismate synthase component I [Anaerohalosphaeraceae bacterium]|nr:aminodeoxychorismate synthase component I [Anaerohalosphaeraceae bacterium]HOL88119.1 aminodeoxychorismate synthase component I [Anaerohalosphaeraceae bacterium]HPP55367.1 aminodeoxychorismate synthase component I [Anaerohalosphaeraceae bacterium]
MQALRPRLCRCFLRPVQSKAAVSRLCETVSRKAFPAVWGGNDSVHHFSVFSAQPAAVFQAALNETALPVRLERALSSYQLAEEVSVSQGAFCGGWMGYFAYELGRFFEKLPGQAQDDIKMPVVWLGFYDKAVLFHHNRQEYWLTAVEIEGENISAEDKFAQLSGWLREAEHQDVPEIPFAADAEPVRFTSRMSRQDYLAALERIRRYIYDGDVYQINLTRRMESPFDGRPIDLFHWHSRWNPSPYAAYLAAEDWAVVSASPELFLQIRDRHICTRPMKGTRPRVSGPNAEERNRMAFRDLAESEKEQAELAMIVDLERNDLARVCVPGSRIVSQFRTIEEYATVYQAVAAIEGLLPRRNDPALFLEILRAVFPGGSVTGAPKIRAMEIIDELEPTARGVYTGAVGWLGLNGDACLNVAIRTTVVKNGCVFLQTGGGIVADSQPQAEWEEMLLKARALQNAVQAVCSRPHRPAVFAVHPSGGRL